MTQHDTAHHSSPDRMAHVVYRTGDKRALLDWYCAVLDGHIVFENDFIGFMTYDDEHHRIAAIQMPGLTRDGAKSAGIHHLAFTYTSMRHLLTNYERLRDTGVSPSHCVNHGPTTSMYYKDPDGNLVELQIDNFPTAAEADAWLHSPEFAENPIGVDFEPETLLQRFRSGESEAVLKTRPNIGPRGLPNRS